MEYFLFLVFKSLSSSWKEKQMQNFREGKIIGLRKQVKVSPLTLMGPELHPECLYWLWNTRARFLLHYKMFCWSDYSNSIDHWKEYALFCLDSCVISRSTFIITEFLCNLILPHYYVLNIFFLLLVLHGSFFLILFWLANTFILHQVPKNEYKKSCQT